MYVYIYMHFFYQQKTQHLSITYIYAVGYGVVTYPKIFQCWRRSSRCTCTIAQFRCSKLPLKFLHARTCRILSVFGYRVLDTWFEGKRVLGIKTHACVQKTYMDTRSCCARFHIREQAGRVCKIAIQKHWYFLTLSSLYSFTVSSSNFALDSTLERTLKICLVSRGGVSIFAFIPVFFFCFQFKTQLQ